MPGEHTPRAYFTLFPGAEQYGNYSIPYKNVSNLTDLKPPQGFSGKKDRCTHCAPVPVHSPHTLQQFLLRPASAFRQFSA